MNSIKIIGLTLVFCIYAWSLNIAIRTFIPKEGKWKLVWIEVIFFLAPVIVVEYLTMPFCLMNKLMDKCLQSEFYRIYDRLSKKRESVRKLNS